MLNLIDDYDPTERDMIARDLTRHDREALGWDDPDLIDSEDFEDIFEGFDVDPEDM